MTDCRRETTLDRGLTLIEMLVAMAITLLMMAAVVTLFANISTSVRDRRAVIELGGQLRQAQQRLNRDLLGATCDGRTWQRPEENPGYIEIVEGRWSDGEPSALLNDPDGDGKDFDGNNLAPYEGELNYATSLVPGSQRTLAEGGYDVDGDGSADPTDGLALGDYDDILALTVRSGGEPFVGRGPGGQRIESHEAEVIWFAVENPADGSLGEPGMRRIYRRVLLIAPWLKENYKSWTALGSQFRQFTQIDSSAPANDFFREYDISSHIDPETGLWTPNTLSDLTKRQNRFAHLDDVWNTTTLQVARNNYPHPMDTSAIRLDPLGRAQGVVNRFPTLSTSPLHPFGWPFEYSPYDGDFENNLNDETVLPSEDNEPVSRFSTQRNPIPLNRRGEDLVLDNALAFDVRVFDPGAPLFSVANGAVLLQPGDIGLRRTVNGFRLPDDTAPTSPIGFGAYVDLAWNVFPGFDSFTGSTNGQRPVNSYPILMWNGGGTRLFGDRPHWRSRLDQMGITDQTTGNRIAYRSATYDTWSFAYENDGINTDGDLDRNGNPLIDEGTNGLDEDYFNDNSFANDALQKVRSRVDDLEERETAPPYDVPLKGIQVRLRVYELDARQVRETSVTHAFD